jgi:hypothetical protein
MAGALNEVHLVKTVHLEVYLETGIELGEQRGKATYE